jgi:DNA-binding MarR family transcriptional regulator
MSPCGGINFLRLCMVNKDSEFALIWSSEVASRGWTQVPNALLEAQGVLGIKSTEMVTLISLLSFMWDRKYPFPSVGTLAKRAGLKRATVQRHLRMLQERGLIERKPRFNQTNVYIITPLILELHTVTKEYLKSGVYQNIDGGGVKELIPNKTHSKNTYKSHTKRGEE